MEDIIILAAGVEENFSTILLISRGGAGLRNLAEQFLRLVRATGKHFPLE